MLHAKLQDHRTSGSGEDFLKVFTIYGHVGHLGHLYKLSSPLPNEAPHKSWLSLAKLFQRRGHLKLWTTDKRPTDNEGIL